MSVVSALFRTLIGLALGLATAFALTPAWASFAESSTMFPVAVILIGGALGLFAPTIRRAFGRGFLLLGASLFALPLSTMLLSGRVAHETISAASEADQGMAALGAGLAGTAMTGAAAFIGFFLGAIFLVAGMILVLGGRREVYVVKR